MTIERQPTTNVVVVTCTPEELHILQTGTAPPGGTPVGKAAMERIERIRRMQAECLRDGVAMRLEVLEVVDSRPVQKVTERR